eukprot:18232-Eustigmatos_ZCMA.PRE.1
MLLQGGAAMNICEVAAAGDMERERAVVGQDPAQIHTVDGYGDRWTPLLFAARGGHVEVVLYLLDL